MSNDHRQLPPHVARAIEASRKMREQGRESLTEEDVQALNALYEENDKRRQALGGGTGLEQFERRVDNYLDWLERHGFRAEEETVTIRRAVEGVKVSERTLRRYVADGVLPTETVKGSRGSEHRIYLPDLFMVLDGRRDAFERSASSPVSDVARQMEALKNQHERERRELLERIESQRRQDAEKDKAFLDAIDRQTRMIDELRAELRDSRAQMHQMQEQVVKALMPPKKPTLLERLMRKS
jgi:DNA-binding transcriptional MerR regulator